MRRDADDMPLRLYKSQITGSIKLNLTENHLILKNKSSSAASIAIVMALTLPVAPLAFAEGVLEGKPDSPVQQFSYAVGVNIAQQIARRFAQDKVEIDSAAMLAAMQDVLDKKDLRLTPEEMSAALDAQRKIQAEKQASAGKANLEAGQAFQKTYGAGEGVEKTESGLLYKVLKAGEGKKPSASDQVVVHYEGTLIDGKVFDSSYERKEPATFGVGQVIPGWQEVLKLMPAGSTWEVVIPSALAYGPQGTPNGIPPNSTLKFKVELIEIK